MVEGLSAKARVRIEAGSCFERTWASGDQNEYIGLLEKFGVEYDHRYIFKTLDE